MPEEQQHDTHHKALEVNLNATIYGTFAEIGAGQEVARWFLQVGGASGTVAETISAYDMTVSDQLYGKVGRYVSRERLAGMLDREYEKVCRRLAQSQGDKRRFFVFADTVSARNYAGTNECHGWIGLRFQTQAGGEANDVILHVNLLDPTNLQQQQAVGVLGVNLIYAVYYHRQPLETFLAMLLDDLSAERVEIDLIDFAGPAFAEMDRHAAMIELVQRNCAKAVVFPSGDRAVPPSEHIHKRPLILVPRIFTGLEPSHAQMLAAARQRLITEGERSGSDPLPLFVLTRRQPADGTSATTSELLQRVADLLRCGIGVMVTQQPELYDMVRYSLRYTAAPVRIVVGAVALADVFHSRRYEQLDGQLMEGLAQLFTYNVRVYVYPTPASAWVRPPAPEWTALPDATGLITLETLQFPRPISHLFAYLVDSGFLQSLPPP